MMKSKKKSPPSPRPKASPRALSVGVGWYTEVEWVKVKAAAVDAERFEDSYVEWVQMAEQALAELQATGVAAATSYIIASELLAWCLAHNKPNNGAARAEFVSEQGRRGHEGGV